MFTQCIEEMEVSPQGIFDVASDTFKVAPIANSFDDTGIDMDGVNASGSGLWQASNGVQLGDAVTLTTPAVATASGIWTFGSADASLSFTSLSDTFVGLLVYNDTISRCISIINFNAERVVDGTLTYTPDATYKLASVSL